MTTPQDVFSSGTASLDERSEKAQRAVRAFRAMQPGLSGYARAITGNPRVSVELAQGTPRTDGTKIYFKPPIDLGDPTPHSRALCEKRDTDTMQQLCPACRIREQVLIVIYHEIAHIVFGTFEKPSEAAKKTVIKRALEETKGKYAEALKKRWDQLASDPAINYLGMASVISPYLPILVNALEDARVDNQMFKARRGTKAMFDAYVQSIFATGIPDEDGSAVFWNEKPLNSQALIGVFVLASGYRYEGWFAPEVEEALGDARLRELTGQIDTVRSSEGSYNLAFPILARLRELGFCKSPDDPEDEQEDDETQDSGNEDNSEDSSEENSEQSGDESSDSGSSQSSKDGEQSSDDPTDSSGEGESDSDEGESSEGQESSGDEEPDSSGEGSDSKDAQSGAVGDESESEDEDSSSREPSTDNDSGEGSSNDASSSDPADGSAGEDHSSDPSKESDVDDEPIDSGADEGEGGIEREIDYGSPEASLKDLQVFGQHEAELAPPTQEENRDEEALDRAIIQGLYFESPSANVKGVREHLYGKPVIQDGQDTSVAWTDRWGDSNYYRRELQRLGISSDLIIPEQILGPALGHMRRAFADNQRNAMERHLRSGKINQRVLGKRAWAGDDRLFQKKRIPGKRSYAVLLGIDISGSTVGLNLALAKRAAAAQAELCNRMGIDFAMYAHTANGGFGSRSYTSDLWLDVYELKSFSQPWNDSTKKALESICADSENLDGHGLEYYRKKIEQHPATDKIILYYSDGKMPAANYHEELTILQREIAYCKSRQITLLGVGIRTDSPRRHGLDTVQVEGDADISKVVRHLETALLHNR